MKSFSLNYSRKFSRRIWFVWKSFNVKQVFGLLGLEKCNVLPRNLMINQLNSMYNVFLITCTWLVWTNNPVNHPIQLISSIVQGCKSDILQYQELLPDTRDRAQRGVGRPSEAREQNSWGFGGAVSPPTGFRGSAPENFWYFSPSRCPETAISAYFKWINELHFSPYFSVNPPSHTPIILPFTNFQHARLITLT